MKKPNVKLRKIFKMPNRLLVLGVSAFLSAFACAQQMTDFMAQPPGVDLDASPAVMLVMSRDNQLWHKAYNDYSDISGDGRIDKSYNDSFKYYGNFNSDFCYEYTNHMFVPTGRVDSPDDSTIHTCEDPKDDGGNAIGERGWSGNFLNWATTTRIDIIRRVLYGGYRYRDEPGRDGTVLQRAMIPNDNHAFVKIVKNTDLIFDADDEDEGRDRIYIADVTPFNEDEISLCNVTHWNDTSNHNSRNLNVVNNPPLLKVVDKAYVTWAGSERSQCMFQGAEQGHSDFSPPVSESLTTSMESGYSGLVVRVQTCVHGFDELDEESCRQYTASDGEKSYKPFGLLQQYGETGQLRFGLMTGSYQRNLEGGVLRKKVSYLGGSEIPDSEAEINRWTGQLNTTSTGPGIIKTINALRIADWDFYRRFYDDCDRLGITITELENRSSTMRCRDWGNPIGEIYAEALRYFQLDQPSMSTSLTNDAGYIDGLTVDSWPANASEDPLSGDGLCANCSIIVLSSGLNEFDFDLGDATSVFTEAEVTSATDRIGELESISGSSGTAGTDTFIFGKLGEAGEPRCTAKSINRLSEVNGMCPEAPSKLAGYKVAGAAYLAHTNDLRPNNTTHPGVQNVDTYAVSLSEPLPTFEIPITTLDGESSISFVPTCHSSINYYSIPESYLANDTDDVWNPCSLVDLTDLTEEGERHFYGKFLISWEASLWGFDHDMDAYVVIEYCVRHFGNSDPACGNYAERDDSNDYYHSRRGDGRDYGPMGARQGTADYYSRHESRPDWDANKIGQLQLRVSLHAASANSAMRFGYIVNGAGSSDGVYDSQLLRYGLYDFNSTTLTGTDSERVIWDAADFAVFQTANGVQRNHNYVSADHKDSKKAISFAPSGDSPKYLNDPLWYAVKYGNFSSSSNVGLASAPADTGAWDLDGDGNPDGYFPIKNPTLVKEALSGIFNNITSKIVSGTAASINLQNSSGDGGIYQALFTPRVQSQYSSNEDVTWVGSLYGLFVDGEGRIREDSNQNGTLDIDTDLVLNYGIDRDGNLSLTESSPNGSQTSTPFSIKDDAFDPVWSAEEELDQQVLTAESRVGNSSDESSISIDYNRSSYATNAENGRFIFTSINRDTEEVAGHPLAQYVVAPKNGISLDISEVNPGQITSDSVQEDVVFEFNRRNFEITKGDHRYFDIADVSGQADVNRLVDYISGIEKAGLRTRTISSGVSRGQRYLLGDIVNSSPVTVGRPKEIYDLYYGDESYRAYRSKYHHRRNVVYVGANDGMLHAFNAGFFNQDSLSFSVGSPVAGVSVTEHPLGSELWAYVPHNLQPHLKWLANPSYAHVYYVDGPVQSFDVKLWPENDTVHEGGWGTIIVVGMRFGGGEYSLDHDGLAETDLQTMRSSYIVMDVTDPERPPELIAEITHPALGFSTSEPTIIKELRYSGEGLQSSEWHLVFGSGPRGDDENSRRRALVDGVSFAPATLFTYDLKRHRLVETILEASHGSEHREEYSYIGGFTAADWDEDYSDDVVYFGLVSYDEGATDSNVFGGKLKRGVIDFSSNSDQFESVNNLFDELTESLPFSSKPHTFKDRETGERWIYAGTGRYFGPDDNFTRQQQSYFGLKEPITEESTSWDYSDKVSLTGLLDTTFIEVFEDGRIRENGSQLRLDGRCGPGSSQNGEIIGENFEDLRNFVKESCGGWRFDFFTQPLDESRSRSSAMRTISPPVPSDSSLLIGAFSPEADQCSVSAQGYLFAPHRSVGVPSPYAALGTDPDRTLPATSTQDQDPEMVIMSLDIGPGIPSLTDIAIKDRQPLAEDQDCHGKAALGQSSTGEIFSLEVNCEPFPAGPRGWAEIPITW